MAVKKVVMPKKLTPTSPVPEWSNFDIVPAPKSSKTMTIKPMKPNDYEIIHLPGDDYVYDLDGGSFKKFPIPSKPKPVDPDDIFVGEDPSYFLNQQVK